MTKIDAIICGFILALIAGAVAGISGYELARAKFEKPSAPKPFKQLEIK